MFCRHIRDGLSNFEQSLPQPYATLGTLLMPVKVFCIGFITLGDARVLAADADLGVTVIVSDIVASAAISML